MKLILSSAKHDEFGKDSVKKTVSSRKRRSRCFSFFGIMNASYWLERKWCSRSQGIEPTTTGTLAQGTSYAYCTTCIRIHLSRSMYLTFVVPQIRQPFAHSCCVFFWPECKSAYTQLVEAVGSSPQPLFHQRTYLTVRYSTYPNENVLRISLQQFYVKPTSKCTLFPVMHVVPSSSYLASYSLFRVRPVTVSHYLVIELVYLQTQHSDFISVCAYLLFFYCEQSSHELSHWSSHICNDIQKHLRCEPETSKFFRFATPYRRLKRGHRTWRIYTT